MATLDGRRVEDALPGRKGRLLFVFLTVNRLRSTTRNELVAALWPDEPPAAADSSLSALISKLRRTFEIEGRSELRLILPDDAFVDLEAAGEAVHRAESAVARGDWAAAWGPTRIAIHTANRGFLPREELPWVVEIRGRLEDLRLRALECAAEAGLGLGGPELDGAKRAARALIAAAPYRESGHRFLMLALAAEGNGAEALTVYERLRTILREELGTAPAPETQALHRRLLG